MDGTVPRNPGRAERWAPVSGLLALLLGAAAAALERPWPATRDPDAFPGFLAANRGPVLAQSMLFVLSAAAFLWFLGALRAYLVRHEGGAGWLSTLAFGAGMTGYGLTVVGQAPQVTLTLPSGAARDPTAAAVLTDLGYVMLALANVPLAVMFTAIAVVSLRTGAYPGWVGWLAAVAAVAALGLTFALLDPTGPLAPQGWLSYLMYLAPILWLISAVVVMVRAGARPGTAATLTGRKGR